MTAGDRSSAAVSMTALDRAGVDHVDRRQGELIGLGKSEQRLQIVSGDDAVFRFHRISLS